MLDISLKFVLKFLVVKGNKCIQLLFQFPFSWEKSYIFCY